MRRVEFPDGWGTATPVDTIHYSKDDLHIAGVLLEDGSNLFALIYPGGQRFVRAAPVADYALEEAFTGEPPSVEDKAAVDGEWRQILAMMIDAGREVDAVLGRRARGRSRGLRDDDGCGCHSGETCRRCNP